MKLNIISDLILSILLLCLFFFSFETSTILNVKFNRMTYKPIRIP